MGRRGERRGWELKRGGGREELEDSERERPGFLDEAGGGGDGWGPGRGF